MTPHQIINRYSRRDCTDDDTFRELGVDAIDRQCIAVDVEEAYGIELTDAQIEAWHSVADVCATVGEMANG